jgi:hypothetical protein
MLDRPLRQVATLLVRKLGTPVTIRRSIPSAYDPATGTQTPTETSTVVKGRFRNYRDRELSDRIHAGDRELMVAAADLDAVPTVDDEVIHGGVTWDVLDVKTELATDLAVLYLLQLRR